MKFKFNYGGKTYEETKLEEIIGSDFVSDSCDLCDFEKHCTTTEENSKRMGTDDGCPLVFRPLNCVFKL